MGRTFAGYDFERVGPILPECDEYGKVIGELPQHRFRNERNLPLSKYGQGPFCRFQVAKGWRQSGVFVLANGDNPLYVGECQNLEDRWGTKGFGGISPRNCYKGGQDTNCRINNLIYEKTRTGENFDLWFHSIEGDKHVRLAAKSRLIASLRPPWNK